MTGCTTIPEGGQKDRVLAGMKTQLLKEGKSDSTINKYIRDAHEFLVRTEPASGGDDLFPDEETIAEYRKHLAAHYKISSVNSMLAGINYLFRYCGRDELQLHAYRVQRDAYRDDRRDLSIEEYRRLVNVAHEEGRDRLCMIMVTMCSTGIRVSELPFITVESLDRECAEVSLKGKTRHVIMPGSLCRLLKDYADSRGLESGSIFVTASGRPVDRSNILHDMKKLSGKAQVDPRKVHPHNLRHLFAVTYYDKYRDLAHLADILGHSNINTTRIYTAIRRGELARNIEALELDVI